MKNRIALTFLCIAIISCVSQAQIPVDLLFIDEKSDFPVDFPLYRIQQGDTKKMGFRDRKGNQIIPCKFDFAQSFIGDSTFVRDDKTQKWGIINKQGILVMPYQFDAPFDWNNDCFKYAFREKHHDCIFEKEDFGIARIDSKLGIINRQGKWIVPPQYEDNRGFGIVFKNGYAAANMKGKTGLINRKGELILSFMYDFVGLFNNGLINVGINRNGFRAGFVNLKNEIVIPLIYRDLTHFEDGFAVAAIMVKNELPKPKKDKVVHVTDKIPDFNSQSSSRDNGFSGSTDDTPNIYHPDSVQMYGVIDTTGKTVIPFQYDGVVYANDGLFAVKEAKTDGKWGFVNAQNQMVIPFQFDLMLNLFYNGVAIVTKMINGESKYFSIDKTGKCVKDCP